MKWTTRTVIVLQTVLLCLTFVDCKPPLVTCGARSESDCGLSDGLCVWCKGVIPGVYKNNCVSKAHHGCGIVQSFQWMLIAVIMFFTLVLSVSWCFCCRDKYKEYREKHYEDL